MLSFPKLNSEGNGVIDPFLNILVRQSFQDTIITSLLEALLQSLDPQASHLNWLPWIRRWSLVFPPFMTGYKRNCGPPANITLWGPAVLHPQEGQPLQDLGRHGVRWEPSSLRWDTDEAIWHSRYQINERLFSVPWIAGHTQQSEQGLQIMKRLPAPAGISQAVTSERLWRTAQEGSVMQQIQFPPCTPGITLIPALEKVSAMPTPWTLNSTIQSNYRSSDVDVRKIYSGWLCGFPIGFH